MSVYKSRRKDASAQFIADARELRRMTARAVKRFPSGYRYIVTNGLLEMAREIVVNAVKGNAVYLHKDLPQGDFDLRHRYLKMAEVTADAYLEEITFAFDTVFIVRKREDITSLDPLREYLGSIGDSLVIGEDDEAFKVHVHTNIPGDALSEAQKYGTLELAKIENMRLQHDDLTAGRKARSTDDLEAVEKELESQPAPQPDGPAAPEKRYGSVAVCAGEGLAGVFRDLGVDEIIEGGQTMNPSTEDILHAIEKTPAEIVFVLPNNKNIIMAAQAAAELAAREVVVIPTKTVPQGISAMLSFDPGMEPSENEAAMTDCLSGVMTMQITYAARDSDFDGFDIHAGDYLGLCDGALAGTTQDITALLATLADKTAAAGKEFINIFYGADISEADAEQALALFQQHAPDAEVNLVSGGQPIYYYLISAE